MASRLMASAWAIRRVRFATERGGVRRKGRCVAPPRKRTRASALARYRVELVARDSSANRSAAVHARFHVVR
jgi:hypothetical protein